MGLVGKDEQRGAVLYRGEEVLGGGWIEEARS